MTILILLNCYFNYKDIERTIISILENNSDSHIIFLENPSKYSPEIRQLAIKYNIYKHYICDDNIEFNILTLFINTHPEIINAYDYIGISEADVVLDKGAILESVTILKENPTNFVGNCSIDLHLYYNKYHKLPIRLWVPLPQVCEKYDIGATGFQFIMFRKQHLLNFIDKINRKEISGGIALGCLNYTGLCDGNLWIYNNLVNKKWLRTKHNKLDHIGWEHYMLDEKDEYCIEKDKNIANGKLRQNIDISKYNLTLLTN